MTEAFGQTFRSLGMALGLFLSVLLCAFALFEWIRPQEGYKNHLNEEEMRLTKVLADKKAATEDRVAAAQLIGSLRNPELIPFLSKELEKNPTCNVVTVSIVQALGEIGDRRALPVLHSFRKMIYKHEFPPQGQFNLVINEAIQRCEGKGDNK